MQLDTLDAVLAVTTHPLVAGLSVVAGQLGARLPAGIELLPDAGGGLNPALTAAAGQLAGAIRTTAWWPWSATCRRCVRPTCWPR